MIHADLRCKCRYKSCNKIGNKSNLTKILLALNIFQKTLFIIKKPYKLIVSSGYRCEKKNKAVGGVSTSQHVQSLAGDIKVAGLGAECLVVLASKSALFDGIGLYNWGIHVDKRGSKARWDFRTKSRKTRLVVDF